ncbi:MAG: hypothetical protein KDC44_12930 [Phaeodactylibacter sp.]|nr:hypothetical protein [Phaeodactylibacter sp.]
MIQQLQLKEKLRKAIISAQWHQVISHIAEEVTSGLSTQEIIEIPLLVIADEQGNEIALSISISKTNH